MRWHSFLALSALNIGTSFAAIVNKCSGDAADKIDKAVTDAAKMARSKFLPQLDEAPNNHVDPYYSQRPGNG